MDLDLTETQEILRRTAREFLTAECPTSLVREMEGRENALPEDLWSRMALMGWMGLPYVESLGGGGGSLTDLAVLVEEMGRFLVPGPFFNTVIEVGLLLSYVGSQELQKKYIPQLASGSMVATSAFQEQDTRFLKESVNCSVKFTDAGYLLNGMKLFVEHARSADFFLVPACDKTHYEGKKISLFMVPSIKPGITLVPMQNMAHEPLFEVKFQNVSLTEDSLVGDIGGGWDPLMRHVELSTVMNCVRSVGGSLAVLDRTVSYVKERVQFGRPIGSFQSVQHDCADMLNAIDAARLATYQSITKLEDGEEASREVALARVLTDRAYKWATLTAQQLHGGIAFMEDYDLQLWTRRARVAELKYETSLIHKERYAKSMGLR